MIPNQPEINSSPGQSVLRYIISTMPLGKRILTLTFLGFRSVAFRLQSALARPIANELFLYEVLEKTEGVGLALASLPDEGRFRLEFVDGYLKNFKVNLRLGGSDARVFSQILIEEEYRPLIELIRQRSSLNDIEYIVDAGANIGLTTLYFKSFFKGASVVALEPDATNFSIMLDNIKANEVNNVFALRAGLWNKVAALEIDRGFRDHLEWSLTLRENDKNSNSSKVEGWPLSAIVEKYSFPRIDILKIDIEGGERFLFEDEETARELLNNVRYLALEIHDEFGIRPKIESALTANGFIYFSVGETLFAHRA